MTAPGRQFNTAVTRFWSLAAPLYDQPLLQRLIYRPAQDEVVAALRAHRSQRVADIACGTGILAARIHDELHPAEVYGVDMSDGMLEQARTRCPAVDWRKGPAEDLPFADAALDAVVSTSAFHRGRVLPGTGSGRTAGRSHHQPAIAGAAASAFGQSGQPRSQPVRSRDARTFRRGRFQRRRSALGRPATKDPGSV